MKTLFLIDGGHGGIDPKSGRYVTAGKRSPKFDDGTVLFEGVNNRDNVERLLEEMERYNLDAIDIVNDWRDISLKERSRRANELSRTRNCVLLSLHSNGAGNGRDWYIAKGIDIFIYNGKVSTNTTRFAALLARELTLSLCSPTNGLTRWRGVKKRNFAILRETNCPAVLIECGFHTDKDEAKLILTDEFKDKLISSIVDACVLYDN